MTKIILEINLDTGRPAIARTLQPPRPFVIPAMWPEC